MVDRSELLPGTNHALRHLVSAARTDTTITIPAATATAGSWRAFSKTTWCLIFFVVVCSWMAGSAIAAHPAADEKPPIVDAGIDDPEWDGLFKAGYHVRYHLDQSSANLWWARFGRYLAAVSSVVALGLSISIQPGTTTAQRRTARWIGCGISTSAAALSILLLLAPHEDNYRQHTILSQQWRRLELQWRFLMDERQALPPDQRQRRIEDLRQEQLAIEQDEPADYDRELLEKYYREETERWHGKTDVASSENPAMSIR